MKLQPDMHDYPPAARRFWWIRVVLGYAIVACSLWQFAGLPPEQQVLGLASILVTAVLAFFPVHIPGLKAHVVCADIFIVLALLLAGVPGAVLAATVEGIVGMPFISKRWTSRILSPAQSATTIFISGLFFEQSRALVERVFPGPAGLIVSLIAFGIVYFMVGMASLRSLFALKNREPMRFVGWWLEAHLIAWWFIASAAVAGLIYLGWQTFGLATLLIAMPVLVMFITTYRALDQTAEISRRKSEFLARMSHELRTPLNAIIGGSQVLAEGVVGPLNERQGQWARDIHESGEHLLAVINDLLDISKIEAGRMDLNRAPIELGAVVTSAITLVKEAASRKRIDLASDVAPDAGVVAADERKLKQVLLNLLSNAIKFTQEGGHVRVSARRDARAVEITVRDTGIGIAQEDQQAVFDAFRQAGDDPAAKARGTGLGLTLARDLVVLHGGTLTLQSAPGQGSTFTIRLPA